MFAKILGGEKVATYIPNFDSIVNFLAFLFDDSSDIAIVRFN